MTAFSAFRLRVPATSANLGPGFDSFGLAVDLYNIFEITPDSRVRVTVTGYSDPELEHPESNLVFTVYRQLCRQHRFTSVTFHIRNHNYIPLYGGIGSSATAIVAAIAITNIIHQANWDKHQMLRIAFAFEQHLDNIAAAIFGGFVVTASYDDTPLLVQKPITSKLCAWVIVPHLRVATSASRAALPKSTSYAQAIHTLAHAAQTAIAFEREDWSMLSHTVVDVLHQPFRNEQCAELLDLRPQLLKAGCYCISISGSGPATLVLCESPTKAMQQLVRKHMQAKKLEWTDFTLGIDNAGVTVT